jgi:hypothetical protein
MKTNKQNFMKTYFVHTLCAIATVAFVTFSGCGTPEILRQPCDIQLSLLNLLDDKALARTATALNVNTWMSDVHQYTFSVTTTYKICQIGYSGNAALFTGNKPYKIEIIKEADGTVIYTGSHKFNSGAIDYQSITKLPLLANIKYIVRRTAIGYSDPIETQGKVITIPSATYFPITNVLYTIHGSSNLVNGKGVDNAGIPYIDLVFE